MKSASWASGGAVVAAVLSSACCWLPLLLLGLGASAAGLSASFEAYRPYFLGTTAFLLGTAFYLVYFRAPRCDPREVCGTPLGKLERANKTLLWVATAAAIGFALFPNYVGSLLGSPDSTGQTITKTGLTEVVLELEGMTCEACAAPIQKKLQTLSGVRKVLVSYEDKSAKILTEHAPNEQALREALEAIGYKVRKIRSIAH